MKRVGHGAARIAGGRREDRQRLIAAVERGEESRHRPRAHVLERERRTVKQLEREDTGLDFHQRDRKIQRGNHNGLKGRRVELRSGVRSQDAIGDLGQRTIPQPGDFARLPHVDRFRHIQTAVRRQPLEHRRPQRDTLGRKIGAIDTRARRNRLSHRARGYESHEDRMRAPCCAISEM